MKRYFNLLSILLAIALLAAFILPQAGSAVQAAPKSRAADTQKAGTQASAFAGLSEGAAIELIAPLCMADSSRTGILASVTIAQFCLESGFGTTRLAQEANNCFGMKRVLSQNTWSGSSWDGTSVVNISTWEDDGSGNSYTIDADFRKYPCIEDSIADHSAYLLDARDDNGLRYAGIRGCRDYKQAIEIIREGGYATDTAYVSKICQLIERWNLTRYDDTDDWKEAAQHSSFGSGSGSHAAENGLIIIGSTTELPFLVEITNGSTEYRSEPSADAPVIGHTGIGKFHITEVKDGWGKLQSGVGWIRLKVAKHRLRQQ